MLSRTRFRHCQLRVAFSLAVFASRRKGEGRAPFA
jgi:hypothetical protein